MNEMTNGEKLLYLQTKLKAPKSQRNTFGNYDYRSAEDINEAVKPLLAEVGATLVPTHRTYVEDGWHYVETTVVLTNVVDNTIIAQSTAPAREPETKKGMDFSQITGAALSYSKKYSMNNIFCLDDTKDADSQAPEQNAPEKKEPEKKPVPAKKTPAKDPRATGLLIVEQLLNQMGGRFPVLERGEYDALVAEWMFDNTDPQENDYRKLPLDGLRKLVKEIGEKIGNDWVIRNNTRLEEYVLKSADESGKNLSTGEEAA